MDEPEPIPEVSVVVCVFNGERFLAAAIDSVLWQTRTAFELVVVDDGSTDGSAAVLARYSDPRLRVLRQRNAGAAAALAAGLQVARGTYVALLDQDDVWCRDKLARHLEVFHRRPKIDLTFSWYRIIDAAGEPMGLHSPRYRGTIGFRDLLRDFVIGGTSNVVVRRVAVARAGGVDPALRRLYDLDLFVRIALLAPDNCAAIPEELTGYRRHPAQISGRWEALRQEWEQTLRKLRQLAPKDVSAVEQEARSNMDRYFARIAYEGGDYGAGLRLLGEAFRRTPLRFAIDARNALVGGACLCGLALPPNVLRRVERIAGLRRGD